MCRRGAQPNPLQKQREPGSRRKAESRGRNRALYKALCVLGGVFCLVGDVFGGVVSVLLADIVGGASVFCLRDLYSWVISFIALCWCCVSALLGESRSYRCSGF